jgi:hypothetical protein
VLLYKKETLEVNKQALTQIKTTAATPPPKSQHPLAVGLSEMKTFWSHAKAVLMLINMSGSNLKD